MAHDTPAVSSVPSTSAFVRSSLQCWHAHWVNRSLPPQATSAGERSLGTHRAPPAGDRILLGTSATGWICAPRQVGALVIGPPRSGKTSGVVIPNVLAWQGPVVVTSTRREVLEICAAARGRRGSVACFDPLGVIDVMPEGVHRLHWSPLRGAQDWDVAQARARALAAGSARGVDHGDHWRVRATQLLSALLHAAALAKEPMSTVVGWVRSVQHEHAAQVLFEQGAEGATAVLAGIKRTPDREQGSIWSTVAGLLAPFDAVAVLRSADAAAAQWIDPDRLLQGKHTLFVVAPADTGVDLAPLVVGLVEEIRSAALRASDRCGTLPLPLLLALDEVATICPLPSLPQIAAEGGGRNIILLAAVQDLSQAAARWGTHVADGLLTLAGAKLVLPGVADVPTLRRLEALAGTHWVRQRSRTIGPPPRLLAPIAMSWHDSVVQTPSFPVDRLRSLSSGTAFSLVAGERAEVVRVASYYRTSPFREWLEPKDPAHVVSPLKAASQAGKATVCQTGHELRGGAFERSSSVGEQLNL